MNEIHHAPHLIAAEAIAKVAIAELTAAGETELVAYLTAPGTGFLSQRWMTWHCTAARSVHCVAVVFGNVCVPCVSFGGERGHASRLGEPVVVAPPRAAHSAQTGAEALPQSLPFCTRFRQNSALCVVTVVAQ